ncbi:hypothetical protein GY631_7321 [Trichophyton interdigitale]|nr:hypothetical protein GY631_7321 [Trichophyton interdigitale]KAG5216769.1 hypothetical protein GY632_7223 [Trichophyton interdigitale]
MEGLPDTSVQYEQIRSTELKEEEEEEEEEEDGEGEEKEAKARLAWEACGVASGWAAADGQDERNGAFSCSAQRPAIEISPTPTDVKRSYYYYYYYYCLVNVQHSVTSITISLAHAASSSIQLAPPAAAAAAAAAETPSTQLPRSLVRKPSSARPANSISVRRPSRSLTLLSSSAASKEPLLFARPTTACCCCCSRWGCSIAFSPADPARLFQSRETTPLPALLCSAIPPSSH